MQGFFNTCKSNNVIHHINKLKQKITYDHCKDAKKFFWKNSTSIYNRNSPGSGLKGIYLNILKVIYDKTTANILLNGKILEAFPLKLETRPGCPLSALLFNIFESPIQSNQRRKRNKRDPDQKRRSKTLTVCRWRDPLYGKP